MTEPMREEPGGRHWRVAGFLDTRYGTVALLITIVLLAQAGLVYVAVDQISTSDEPTLVQPANGTRPAAPPISVDASDRTEPSAPAAERRVQTLDVGESAEESSEEAQGGRDVAAERRPTSTPTAPPEEVPAAEPAQPSSPAGPEEVAERPAPSGEPAPQDDRTPPPSEGPASENQDPHDHQEGTSEPPAEDQETQHGRHDHGPQEHEPPGQGGDNPGNGTGGTGGGNGTGGGKG